jgi:hypothetical protein
MVGRQVVDCHRHDDTHGSEYDAIGRVSVFESPPVVSECSLIDMPIDPIAIVKIEFDKPINDVEGGKAFQ